MLAIVAGLYAMISGKGINIFNKGFQEIEGSKAKAQGLYLLIFGGRGTCYNLFYSVGILEIDRSEGSKLIKIIW